MGKTVIMVTKGGEEGEHNSGQNNDHTIAFFQGKTTFMITFKEKLFLIFTSLVLKRHMQTVA